MSHRAAGCRGAVPKKMLWETNKITFRWPYIDQPHFGKTYQYACPRHLDPRIRTTGYEYGKLRELTPYREKVRRPGSKSSGRSSSAAPSTGRPSSKQSTTSGSGSSEVAAGGTSGGGTQQSRGREVTATGRRSYRSLSHDQEELMRTEEMFANTVEKMAGVQFTRPGSAAQRTRQEVPGFTHTKLQRERRPETAPAVSRPLKYSQNQGQTVSPTPVMCRCYDAPRLKKYHDRPPMFESPDNEHPSELRVLFGDTLSGGDSVMSGM
eukprot:CAMPEP_0179005718 /NCGR_PEP_ID=MMETSP0795-20121207/14112_1 /TAXON_ID=88552 /ORGANISM="Amoebophrya sp., Strain Ameob2" /LENGTH=264 /DNA_ID=CAMNT_0020700315 /DNA_START=443 /DNA_END=1237 /DNA_ORIENTATION=+